MNKIQFTEFNPPEPLHTFTASKRGMFYLVERFVRIGEVEMKIDFAPKYFITRRGMQKFISQWFSKNE